MANTVGPLIKEARSKAKLSQEALASQIDGLSAADISKAERGEKELSQSALRQIAKLTGVTQSSLINAAKESTYGAAAGKTTSTAKKTSSSTKKTTTTAKKTSTSSKNTVELTAVEKKLIELYRAADSDTKKKATAVLKGEQTDASDIINTIIDSAMGMLGKK